MNLNPNPPRHSGHQQPPKANPLFTLLAWVSGILFLLVALASLSQFHISLVFALAGLLLLPPSYRFIAKKLKLQLNPGTRVFSVLVLIIIAAILIGSSSDPGKQEKQEKQHSSMNAARQQQLKDSLNFNIQASTRYKKEHKLNAALTQLRYAYAFASTPDDTVLITKESADIGSIEVDDLIHAGKYEGALHKLDSLIPQNPDNSDLLYSRAICYRKKKRNQEAAADCKSAMQLGNKNAEALYNKVNPPLKRVSYYITRCCDGTTSSSTGRGTCSHHGGVCQLSQPVYEEYRKYE